MKIVIIGAGAAGLFCAGLLGQQGLDVTVIDQGKKVGRKILMSGGGFCNFTNLHINASHYLSKNPHFCKSALTRFSQWNFIELVNQYRIPYHEKEAGQLFCDHSAQDIVNMLLAECQKGSVKLMMQTTVDSVAKSSSQFAVHTNHGDLLCDKLIIATGGLSMPKLGTTPIGYQIAEQFGLSVEPVRAGLVPFTLHKPLLDKLSVLAGVALPVNVATHNMSFNGNMLFTHRGLSGPAILQISSYWQAGEAITIDLFPQWDLQEYLQQQRQIHANQQIKTIFAPLLPKRLIDVLIELNLLPNIPLKQLNHKQQLELVHQLTHWQIIPNGTEGYRTAEVTIGGVSTDMLSSKTMATYTDKNLYFIGEVIDVTGWLGGYNFQWAWSSAYACVSDIIK